MSTASVGEAESVFDGLIAPAIFEPGGPEESPTLTLGTGEAGSGVSAAISRAAGERPGVAALHTDDLLAFHPDFSILGRGQPETVGTVLEAATSDWLAGCLAYALDGRRSLIVGSSFAPETAIGLVDAFSAAGFATHLTVVAARRPESLLASVSAYLETRRLRLPAVFVSAHEHELGWQDAATVAAVAATITGLDRLSVVNGTGAVLFDADRSEGSERFGNAADALLRERERGWTTTSATAWLSELRRVTEFAREARELTPAVAGVLLELQVSALHEVLPQLPLRSGSPVIAEQERRIGAELAALRAVAAEIEPAPEIVPDVISAPEYVPAPQPEPDGPSL